MRAKRLFNSLLILVCVTLLAVVGCTSLVDRVTPADVSPHAPRYIGQEPKDIYSLYDLKRLQDDVSIEHRNVQVELLRLTEDDTFGFEIARGFIEAAIREAEEFKSKVIGDESNPLGVYTFLSLLTGGLIGRSYFRRPGDLTPDEARAKGAVV